MSKISKFEFLGGQYWETTAMRNLLNYYGLDNPFSKKPFSESLCLGISGGIGAGYSFCPSIPRNASKNKNPSLDRKTPKAFNESLYKCGSGSSLIGRTSSYSTSGGSYRSFFDRLGIKTNIHESSGIKGAAARVVEAIDNGDPCVVWTCPVPFSSLGFVGTCGMYTLIVTGIDEDSQTVTLADRAKSPFTMSVDDLNFCRGRVCSLKNRSLTISPPKAISQAKMKAAIRAGIEDSVRNILKPKMKTFGPPGLIGLSKTIANAKNQKGWPKVYPDGMIYQALRDLYDSIETAATGGGFYRPMFSDFLLEASDILNKKNLKASAAQYEDLSSAWTQFAEQLLPNKVKEFKRTKALLKKIDKSFIDKGPKAQSIVEKSYGELETIQSGLRKKFVWSPDETIEFLSGVGEQLEKLVDQELEAASSLAKNI